MNLITPINLQELFKYCEESNTEKMLKKAGFGIKLVQDQAANGSAEMLVGKSMHYNEADMRNDKPTIHSNISFISKRYIIDVEFTGIRELGKVKPNYSAQFKIECVQDLESFFDAIKAVYLEQIGSKYFFKALKMDFYRFFSIMAETSLHCA